MSFGAGMTEILVGDRVPLSVQSFDQNPSLKILARIHSMDGELLESTYLYHAMNGLYLNTEVLMPNKIIIATYAVENNNDYMTGAEKFSPIEAPKQADKFVSGFVIEKTKDQEFITGVVSEIASY